MRSPWALSTGKWETLLAFGGGSLDVCFCHLTRTEQSDALLSILSSLKGNVISSRLFSGIM